MSVTLYHKKKTMPEPTVQTEPPAVIPPTPVTEEAIPQKIEEKTEDTEPIDTAPIGNAPVFVDPAHGDPNPFENAPPTEIEDHPVDEFIEEGDDKPAAERDPCGFFQSVEFYF